MEIVLRCECCGDELDTPYNKYPNEVVTCGDMECEDWARAMDEVP